MDLKTLTEYTKNISLVTLLCIFIWAAVSGQVVLKSQADDLKSQIVSMKEERDKWIKVAVEGTRLAQVAAEKSNAFTLSPEQPLGPAIDINNITIDSISKKLDNISDKIEPGIERLPLSKVIR